MAIVWRSCFAVVDVFVRICNCSGDVDKAINFLEARPLLHCESEFSETLSSMQMLTCISATTGRALLLRIIRR